jgi:hypothetical protein
VIKVDFCFDQRLIEFKSVIGSPASAGKDKTNNLSLLAACPEPVEGESKDIY